MDRAVTGGGDEVASTHGCMDAVVLARARRSAVSGLHAWSDLHEMRQSKRSTAVELARQLLRWSAPPVGTWLLGGGWVDVSGIVGHGIDFCNL
ncbi:basic proline-rich protein-like [Iris pallida]|uniref:Basic proline-rich protein-like n=1 Tax=Iris pallida TaxID=29817 RepID=A0AAX6E8C8_IRIPA|nr:basic proline-rich protein-like [Iris pallida]